MSAIVGIYVVETTPVIVEATVDKASTPRPEVVLMEAITNWLAQASERYIIESINLTYRAVDITALVTLTPELP